MPDRWLVLSVRVPSDELTEELAEGLVALGGSAVQQDGDQLTTYLTPPAEADAFVAEAAERLRSVTGSSPELNFRWQADEDWSRQWRQGLEPRQVGRRLIVAQPWNESEARLLAAGMGDPVIIVIDPATAFGTGEHATTRGALRLMERVLGNAGRGAPAPALRVLDVGTGSGILALAAAELGAGRVLAVESDPDSMGNARENLDRSKRGGAIELVNALVDEAYLDRVRDGGFHLIVANVLSGVLIPLLPAFAAALTADGRVILGGILEAEASAVVAAAAAACLTVEAEDREEGWWTALFRPAER
jgi:ribosomal protein L11 methyltransferase